MLACAASFSFYVTKILQLSINENIFGLFHIYFL